MRDMIVLHYPFARPSVASPFKPQVPSRARKKAEAVARGKRGADAPARRRGTRFQIARRSYEQERQTGIGGGKMQPLTGFQIELVDAAGDGGRRARPQRLLDRPQRVVAVRGFHQDQAGRIETERAQTMTIRAAAMAQPVSRQNEDDFFSLTSPRVRGEVDPPQR
jgi:hypothetical protein